MVDDCNVTDDNDVTKFLFCCTKRVAIEYRSNWFVCAENDSKKNKKRKIFVVKSGTDTQSHTIFFFFFRISFTGKETVSQIGILSRMSTKKRQQKPKYGTIYSDEWMQNVCEMQLERRQKKNEEFIRFRKWRWKKMKKLCTIVI